MHTFMNSIAWHYARSPGFFFLTSFSYTVFLLRNTHSRHCLTRQYFTLQLKKKEKKKNHVSQELPLASLTHVADVHSLLRSPMLKALTVGINGAVLLLRELSVGSIRS